MIKVYCDNGGYQRDLKGLETKRRIELVMFPHENKTKKIKNSGLPTKMTINDMQHSIFTYTQPIAEFIKSDRFDEMLVLIGHDNRKDVQHLDSAYKSKCSIFITSIKRIFGASE